jgi:hypothetical protein
MENLDTKQSEKLLLDGKEIDLKTLKEMQSNPKFKIVEVSKNVYKTLEKLKG